MGHCFPTATPFRKLCPLLGLLGGLALSPAHLRAQDSVLSDVYYNLPGTTIGHGQFGEDGAPVSTSYSTSFSGMDGAGQTQTMTFSGSASGSAQYGQLRASASGTVTNTYYNPNNPSGTPTGFLIQGLGSFEDTLQYGGALQSGYQARCIFHLDGTVSGADAAPYLNVTIAGQSQEFTTAQTGELSLDWATTDVPINGQTAQQIIVDFSTDFSLDLSDGSIPDGSNVSGMAQFSDTLTLTAIEVVDANGNPVSGVTINSDSGTAYPMGVPEPGTYALVVPAALLWFVGRWRMRRRSGYPITA